MPRRTFLEFLKSDLVSEFQPNRVYTSDSTVYHLRTAAIEPILDYCQRVIGKTKGPRFALSCQIEERCCGGEKQYPVISIYASRDSGPKMGIVPILVMAPGVLNLDDKGANEGPLGLIDTTEDLQPFAQVMKEYINAFGEHGRFAVLTDMLSAVMIDFGSSKQPGEMVFHRDGAGKKGRNTIKEDIVDWVLNALTLVGWDSSSD